MPVRIRAWPVCSTPLPAAHDPPALPGRLGVAGLADGAPSSSSNESQPMTSRSVVLLDRQRLGDGPGLAAGQFGDQLGRRSPPPPPSSSTPETITSGRSPAAWSVRSRAGEAEARISCMSSADHTPDPARCARVGSPTRWHGSGGPRMTAQDLLVEMFERMVIAKDASRIEHYYHPEFRMTANGHTQDSRSSRRVAAGSSRLRSATRSATTTRRGWRRRTGSAAGCGSPPPGRARNRPSSRSCWWPRSSTVGCTGSGSSPGPTGPRCRRSRRTRPA